MTMYVVKKHEGRWSVSASDGGVVTFDSYDEAVETARVAAVVIAEQSAKPRAKSSEAPQTRRRA